MFKLAGSIFVVWGLVVMAKGACDIFLLSPESHFVSLAAWVGRWAPFEIVYGTACVIAGLLCFERSRRTKKPGV